MAMKLQWAVPDDVVFAAKYSSCGMRRFSTLGLGPGLSIAHRTPPWSTPDNRKFSEPIAPSVSSFFEFNDTRKDRAKSAPAQQRTNQRGKTGQGPAVRKKECFTEVGVQSHRASVDQEAKPWRRPSSDGLEAGRVHSACVISHVEKPVTRRESKSANCSSSLRARNAWGRLAKHVISEPEPEPPKPLWGVMVLVKESPPASPSSSPPPQRSRSSSATSSFLFETSRPVSPASQTSFTRRRPPAIVSITSFTASRPPSTMIRTPSTTIRTPSTTMGSSSAAIRTSSPTDPASSATLNPTPSASGTPSRNTRPLFATTSKFLSGFMRPSSDSEERSTERLHSALQDIQQSEPSSQDHAAPAQSPECPVEEEEGAASHHAGDEAIDVEGTIVQCTDALVPTTAGEQTGSVMPEEGQPKDLEDFRNSNAGTPNSVSPRSSREDKTMSPHLPVFANEIWYQKGCKLLAAQRANKRASGNGDSDGEDLDPEMTLHRLTRPTASSRSRQVTQWPTSSYTIRQNSVAAHRKASSSSTPFLKRPNRFKGTRNVTSNELREIVNRLSACDPANVPDSGRSRSRGKGFCTKGSTWTDHTAAESRSRSRSGLHVRGFSEELVRRAHQDA